MDDPNPYEPPKVTGPLRPAQLIKPGIGIGLILLLTPPAMAIAVLTSCTLLTRFTPHVEGVEFIAAVLPLVVLTGLMVWASVLARPRKDDPNQMSPRIGYLLITPVVVLLALAVGFGLAMLAVFIVTSSGGDPYGTAFPIAVIVFWLTPSAALLFMLWLAWRAVRN